MKTIIKRDGREVEFQKEKIASAIRAAMKDTKEGVDEDLVQKITNRVDKRFTSGTVEDVQNTVELELMKSKRKEVAKAYVNYRYLHGLAREKYQELINLVLEKAMAAEDQKQNANVDEKSFGGRSGEANDVMMRQLAMDYILSPTARENHINNMIYTHDLNSYLVGCHNCLSVPLDDLLAKGFNTRQTDVRPAQSINTAMQLVAVLFQIQSLQQFGGVSATHLDWTMVPYVRKSFWKHYRDGMQWVEQIPNSEIYKSKQKDKDRSIEDPAWKKYTKAYTYAVEMTQREAVQAVEGLFHNLNTLQSRSGNQLK